MCRHLAYLGPAVPLRSLLLDPPHSLYRQSWAPRLQRHGTVNADGFGIGWYADHDPVPARYRQGVPIWGDPSLPDLARVTRSRAVLAAVRSATPGTATGAEAAAPFGSGPWLFSHNGAAERWREWAERAAAANETVLNEELAADKASRAGDGCGNEPPMTGPLPQPSGAAALLSLEAMVDSAFLGALVFARLRAGQPMGAALAATIAAAESVGGTGRFNFLLTDGHAIAATACGDTLWYRQGDGSVVVASEPSDDEPGWVEVPDRYSVTATPRGVTAAPLGADVVAPADQAPSAVAAG